MRGATPKPTAGEAQKASAAHFVMVSGTTFSMFTKPLSLYKQIEARSGDQYKDL